MASHRLNDARMAPSLPTLDDVLAARERIRGLAWRTPLVRLQHDGTRPIHLKLENLQPIGSFKVRCGANALLSRTDDERRRGIVTASAGNFAQGLAYAGRALNVAVTAVVPETAARSKLDALRALGATIVTRSYADWWSLLESAPDTFEDRTFVHPVIDSRVLAGNGTIGLEIVEDLPDVETVLVPYGGGGLSVGIAACVKALRPATRVFASETEAGRPVAAAFAAGEPVAVSFDAKTFITGMGSPRVLDAMWPLVRQALDGAVHASLAETAAAVRLLMLRHHVIAEGAGAAPVAAALRGVPGSGPVVCIVSGGHLDPEHISAILNGEIPRIG